MHRKIAARIMQHVRRRQPLQPRQATAEALRHAVAMREVQVPLSKQHEFWAGVVEVLKDEHLKMPKY